jgi:peptide-methionine (S)-S-oxide reductase
MYRVFDLYGFYYIIKIIFTFRIHLAIFSLEIVMKRVALVFGLGLLVAAVFVAFMLFGQTVPRQSKSASLQDKKDIMESKGLKNQEIAVLGGGCFWCLEAVFERVEGVVEVVSGYAGGSVANPTYEEVCSGNTGQAEVIRITYDPKLISYKELLDIFWLAHDPTTLNRQGSDVGTQYRSIILYNSEEQRKIALESKQSVREKLKLSAPVVTEIVPLQAFYPAEKYHQNYYDENRGTSYCLFVIHPKLKKLGLE